MNTIGDRFKYVRESSGGNQAEFAKDINVNSSLISDIERGQKEPSKNVIINLIKRYKINSNWLLTGIGEPFIIEKEDEKNALVIEVEKIIDSHIGEKTDQRFESIEYQITLLKKQFEKLSTTGECELCDPEPSYGEKVKIPFVENIAAGPPIEQSYTQGTEVEIPSSLIHGDKEDFYAARVSGDSMTEAGISSGEIILVKKNEIPVHGKIQVVRYLSKSTLKRVCKNGDLWELHFEDGTNRVIQVRENDYQIQGDFISVIGKFVKV